MQPMQPTQPTQPMQTSSDRISSRHPPELFFSKATRIVLGTEIRQDPRRIRDAETDADGGVYITSRHDPATFFGRAIRGPFLTDT